VGISLCRRTSCLNRMIHVLRHFYLEVKPLRLERQIRLPQPFPALPNQKIRDPENVQTVFEIRHEEIKLCSRLLEYSNFFLSRCTFSCFSLSLVYTPSIDYSTPEAQILTSQIQENLMCKTARSYTSQRYPCPHSASQPQNQKKKTAPLPCSSYTVHIRHRRHLTPT
jgi:hypothetical protein